jgi:uncharacterized protein (TIGR02266 family)
MNTSKDSRRDPRAKILSLTVRYKSATVAEFIEDHSYDVSRGGMFIRTSAPFPTGTLLKFEVRIAEEQRVMTGVGRVTWRREKDTGEDSPAGMGVKFIKIEDDSIEVIDQLIKTRANDVSSFEAGAKEQGIPLSDPPSNLRVGKEDRSSSRPPPAGDMLDQSASLLKSAMGTLSQPPGDKPGEERVTLPTGQSNPLQKAISLADLAAVKGEPSERPPAPSAKPEVTAVAKDEPRPAAGAASAASVVGTGGDRTDDAEGGGPPSSEPASQDSPVSQNSQPSPDSASADGGERGDKRSKSNGKKKGKKEKKRKKKFRYASIPVPKQQLARAVAPSSEPLSLATVTTTPPRKRQTEAPPPSRSNNAVWVVLGLVAVGLGLYWVSRSATEDVSQRAPQAVPAMAAPSPPKASPSALGAQFQSSQVLRAGDLPPDPPKAAEKSAAQPTVVEEPNQGTVTEELDEVERKPAKSTPRAAVRAPVRAPSVASGVPTVAPPAPAAESPKTPGPGAPVAEPPVAPRETAVPPGVPVSPARATPPAATPPPVAPLPAPASSAG